MSRIITPAFLFRVGQIVAYKRTGQPAVVAESWFDGAENRCRVLSGLHAWSVPEHSLETPKTAPFSPIKSGSEKVESVGAGFSKNVKGVAAEKVENRSWGIFHQNISARFSSIVPV